MLSFLGPPLFEYKDELPRELQGKTFPVWGTVQLGTRPKEELVAALEEEKVDTSIWTPFCFSRMTVASELREVSLVKVSGLDLCFDKPVALSAIVRRGMLLGLQPCLEEVAPQVALQISETTLRNSSPILFAMGDDVGEWEIWFKDGQLHLKGEPVVLSQVYYGGDPNLPMRPVRPETSILFCSNL
ncbi:MAG: hypothetical protein WDZ79_01995 [Candidatus Paceibacterota bacterium]